MEISDTKTQQVITLFIILLVQLSPTVLTLPDTLPETRSSLGNPISRQHRIQIVIHNPSPQTPNSPPAIHTPNHRPSSLFKTWSQPEQPQNPIPKPHPTEQPQNPIVIPNPSQQSSLPQNPNPNRIEQPKQPQNPTQPQGPTPSPSTQPRKSPFQIPDIQPLKDLFKNLNPKNQAPDTDPSETLELFPKCSRTEVEEILRVHNEARVHESEPVYVWDEDVADYARNYAKKRIFDCKVIHSHGPFGENIFWGLNDHWTIAKAVKSWIDEEKDYDKKRRVCQLGKLCGHYTQIVWRDSIKVGCARVKCAYGLGFFIMCSYDPPGNFPNEDPFVSHERT